MLPFRKVFAAFFLVGTVTVGGVACGSSSKSSESAESTSAWCKRFEEFDKKEAETDLATLSEMFDSLAEDAPKEIRDEMKVVAAGYKESLETVESPDSDAMDQGDSDEKSNAATDRVAAYAKDVCGYELPSS